MDTTGHHLHITWLECGQHLEALTQLILATCQLLWTQVDATWHHLSITWVQCGQQLGSTWWSPGNHLVTTWWPLVEQLVTPLFYIANWRPPDSWLLVERTYSNTGCPKINHFKSGQFLPQLLLATAATTRSEFKLFERGPCCSFWFLFGYFWGAL